MTKEIDGDLEKRADEIAVSSRYMHNTCVILKNDIARFAQDARDESKWILVKILKEIDENPNYDIGREMSDRIDKVLEEWEK